MSKRHFISGSLLGLIGYLLSPLSWWNDWFLNIPLAYAGAWLVSLIWKHAFLPAFIGFYWATNIIGLIMLHKGIVKVVNRKHEEKRYSRRALAKDIAVSLIYTAVIVILVRTGVIRPPGGYF
jgi:cadmium resistance protein CadD (predicted permease)